jgi:hypothetical protein
LRCFLAACGCAAVLLWRCRLWYKSGNIIFYNAAAIPGALHLANIDAAFGG